MKLRKISLFLILFWLILAGLTVWFKVVPLGRATYQISYPKKFSIFGGKSFIGQLTPTERVLTEKSQFPKIISDPVYFSVFTPRTFSDLKLTVTYKDNLSANTPIFEAGVLVDNVLWRYQLAPLENKLLDNNFKDWFKIQTANDLLLQKNNKFSDIPSFLNNLDNLCDVADPRSCLALYNKELKYPIKLSQQSLFSEINIPLQGAHQFYFSAEALQPLTFKIKFRDLNLNQKSDPIIVNIYSQGEKLYSTTISDDFGTEGLGVSRDFLEIISYQNKSSELSLYKIEFKMSDDVIIEKIIDAPSALAAINKLHPIDLTDQELNFWTETNYLKLTTINPSSLQDLSFGNQEFNLASTYEQFEFINKEPGLKKIQLSKGGVILENSGLFFFEALNFSNPDFVKVDRYFAGNKKFEYIFANYQSPKILSSGVKEATVVLNTKEAYREKGKYSFILSIPGLATSSSNYVEIVAIKMEFSGRTLLEKIKEKIQQYVN